MSHFLGLKQAFADVWTAKPLAADATLEQLKELTGGTQVYRVRNKTGFVSRWSCSRFAGCNLLVVTSDVIVREDLRGKGIGTFLRQLRQTAYRKAGFKGEMCTVRSDNNGQIKIMEKLGARVINELPSDRGGMVRLYLTAF